MRVHDGMPTEVVISETNRFTCPRLTFSEMNNGWKRQNQAIGLLSRDVLQMLSLFFGSVRIPAFYDRKLVLAHSSPNNLCNWVDACFTFWKNVFSAFPLPSMFRTCLQRHHSIFFNWERIAAYHMNSSVNKNMVKTIYVSHMRSFLKRVLSKIDHPCFEPWLA